MRAIVSFSLLLLVVVGLGGANFYRNLQEEKRQERAFGSYSDADIQAMVLGMLQEVDQLNALYEAQKGIDSRARNKGSMKGNIDEFERVQDATRLVKDLGQDASQKEVLLRELQEEAELRSRNSDALQVFIRRVTTF